MFLQVIEIGSVFQDISLDEGMLIDVVIIDFIEFDFRVSLSCISYIDTQRDLLLDAESTVIV